MMSIMCAEAEAQIAMLERRSGEPAQRVASWIRGANRARLTWGAATVPSLGNLQSGCSRRTPPRATLAARTPRRSHAG